jgi:hypothetical protein
MRNTLIGYLLSATVAFAIFTGTHDAFAQAAQTKSQTGQQILANPALQPHLEEWVYHIKSGYEQEWWKIFKKYQIADLEKEKAEGIVLDYKVYSPNWHTSEDARWNYRVIIIYRDGYAANHLPSPGEASRPRQTHQIDEERQKEEARRWELTVNHWDLAIHEVDPQFGF